MRNLWQGEIGSQVGGERGLARILVWGLRRQGRRWEPVVGRKRGGADQRGEGARPGLCRRAAGGERRWLGRCRSGEGGFREENPRGVGRWRCQWGKRVAIGLKSQRKKHFRFETMRRRTKEQWEFGEVGADGGRELSWKHCQAFKLVITSLGRSRNVNIKKMKHWTNWVGWHIPIRSCATQANHVSIGRRLVQLFKRWKVQPFPTSPPGPITIPVIIPTDQV